LLIKEQEKTGLISLGGFYRRRALRIFPAFYVFWIAAVGSTMLAHGARNVPWSQAFSAFFYVSNYFHAMIHSSPEFIIHTWSLSAEEQFYLLWPLTFLLFSKKRRALMTALVLVIGAIWFHRWHVWMAAQDGNYITYAFDTRADALLVGCLFALGLKEGIGQGLLDKLCQPAWGPLLTSALIGISEYAGRISEEYKLTGGLAIEPILVAASICQLIVQSGTWQWKWLDSKPAAYLGRISYPLYLYHMLATHVAGRIAGHFPGRSTFFFVAISLFVAILIASCSYYIVEKPFLALKEKRSASVTKARDAFAPPKANEESGATVSSVC
jgi:peptidoglycan/LPS O-acetylase OafA/YrhL